MSLDLAVALNLKLNPSKNVVHVGNSLKLKVNYESRVKLINGDKTIEVKVGILSTKFMLSFNYAHVLIGNDILRLCGTQLINYKEMTLHLENVQCFALCGRKFGFKKNATFSKICRYTNPPHVQEIIDIKVNKLITNGVLEKCDTPRFISNLNISTRKKDDKKRVCVDLRSLNSCIERIPTYLASSETVIAKLSNA
uniref:Recep_L_domain domain-containing protein n=1 Tax=Strongyloides venezuelensis TaxID=75913 RepID=A0A0K0F530_STRVS